MYVCMYVIYLENTITMLANRCGCVTIFSLAIVHGQPLTLLVPSRLYTLGHLYVCVYVCMYVYMYVCT